MTPVVPFTCGIMVWSRDIPHTGEVAAVEENAKLFMEERREQILEMILLQKRMTISELAQAFKLGEVTIRRDLSELESRGLIRRTHGGAIPAENMAEEVSLKIRENQHAAEKHRIADLIYSLVRNGESLMMDGGSTTLCIATKLKNKSNLTVVTNSPLLANEFVGYNNNKAILVGGDMQEKTLVTVGPIAEQALRQFRVDRVIIGMSAMMPDEGFFTISHFEAEIKRSMLKLGKEVIIAMDSSKIGKVGFSFVTGFENVDKLVIDESVKKEDYVKIEKHNMDVFVV